MNEALYDRIRAVLNDVYPGMPDRAEKAVSRLLAPIGSCISQASTDSYRRGWDNGFCTGVNESQQ
jgi:hypothetical protein